MEFDQDEYEVRCADYLRGALTSEDEIGVYVRHTIKDASGNLEITVGSLPADTGRDSAEAECVESGRLDDEREYSVWQLPDGTKSLMVHCPPQRPDLVVPFFSITLVDWPLERSPEIDLGPGVRRALRLLAAACMEARRHSIEKMLIRHNEWAALDVLRDETAGSPEPRVCCR